MCGGSPLTIATIRVEDPSPAMCAHRLSELTGATLPQLRRTKYQSLRWNLDNLEVQDSRCRLSVSAPEHSVSKMNACALSGPSTSKKPRSSLVGREYEWELMPLALDQKIGTVVWSPLGWGRLTGRMRRGQPLPETSRLQSHAIVEMGPPIGNEHVYRVVDAIDEVSKETGKSVPQIAINWLLQRPTVATVIIGARNADQLRQNLGAAGWNLTAPQIAKLDAGSEITPIYPYWHQRGFAERNPSPIAQSSPR